MCVCPVLVILISFSVNYNVNVLLCTTGSDDGPVMSVAEVIQVIVPCIAVPVLVGVLLLVVHLCRRYHSPAAGAPIKPPQATRRQHGTPTVAANNAVGLYLHFFSAGPFPIDSQVLIPS